MKFTLRQTVDEVKKKTTRAKDALTGKHTSINTSSDKGIYGATYGHYGPVHVLKKAPTPETIKKAGEPRRAKKAAEVAARKASRKTR